MDTTMLRPVRRVLVCGNRRQQGHLDEIADFMALLAASGVETVAETRFADYLAAQGVRLPAAVRATERMPDGIDAVVSIGGDGTFLRAARIAGRSGVPILGVNTGHLGFLASYTLADRRELVAELREGRAQIEARAVLCVECDALGADEWPYALNELAVLKEETSSMITVRAEVDGHYLADYLADGLVVATATGSTAYSLSAGGPILAPTLPNMVISPLAPHSLTLRPLVIDGDSRLRLSAESRSGRCRLSLDGRSSQVPSGTELTVSRAPFNVYVIRRLEDDFASILRNKLSWGVR